MRSSGVTTKTLALIDWEDSSKGRLINIGKFLDENLKSALLLGWVQEIHQFFDILRGKPVKIFRPSTTKNWNAVKSRSVIKESNSYNTKRAETPKSAINSEAVTYEQATEISVESKGTLGEQINEKEIDESEDSKSNVAADRRSMY